ncbi:MAG TPA: hydrogen gas-evolving membrane-bound hydrogenase subunit E, partial [Thermomicrobiales bacterium]|nr:hydrogen gas-evolving membrane-bound hydrogenase subunit E [Thermomicrobiales bacterium]
DLILIFVFWDLTAIASYFLIGFDRAEEESRSSAQMALLVTGITAIFVLLGALALFQIYGTFSLPEIISASNGGRNTGIAVGLIVLGALAKSAQVPMHFWLPRAMAAPTPVSAYLHSAAMVAAGVFLIGRVYPLVEQYGWMLNALLIIGFASMAVGGIIALTRRVLKQILAYSTISQYGYVVAMFGMGGEEGVAGATFYVLAHALAKSALFMTAGAVTEATGKKNLPDVGGLMRRMPLLAAGSGLAAAGIIALPLAIGFFKDELFFAAAYARGTEVAVMSVLGAALTFAYILRFWWQTFMGPLRAETRAVSGYLVWPVVVLGIATLVGGVWTAPATGIVDRAASVSADAPIHLHIAYHLDARHENVMAIATWVTGLLIYLTRRIWWPAALGVAHLGSYFGPARLYYAGMQGLNQLSDSVHRIEVRDLRSRVATILLPAGLLVGLALIVTPNAVRSFDMGSLNRGDIPIIAMLVASVASALVVVVVRDHFRLAISLSSVGFSLAGVYAFMGAPDVTLVALVVETVLSMFMIGMLVLMPRPILRFETEVRAERRYLRRDLILAMVAASMAFFVVWGALSRPSPSTEVIDSQTVLTAAVHGKDIVTVILADFRGFDTMGEATVIALTLLGVISLLRTGRLR